MDVDRHLHDDFWKNEERITYEIREAIQVGRDLRNEVEKLDRLHGPRAKELIPEALKLKDVGRGFNILMHAASVGHLPSFTSAVAVVNERLGRKGLVKQLRQSDVHGAPLVFQAAASSELTFFESVCKTVTKTLGSSELRQQLQAIDLHQRSIIFYAAKGQNADVFHAAVDGFNGCGPLFHAFDGRGSGIPRRAGHGEQKAEEHRYPRDSWLLLRDHRPDKTKVLPGRVARIGERYVVIDYKGMNVLHVACRRGSPAIVTEVIQEARRQGESFIKYLMSSVDDGGSTPLMQALRRDNLGDLLRVLVDQNDNAPLSKSEQLKLFTESASPDHDCTALMHAAYAGPERLEIVRDRVKCLVNLHLPPSSQACDDHDDLDLDTALGVKKGDGKKRMIRRGNFLAAAISGGHCCVLDEVVLALKTGVLRRPPLASPLTDGSEQNKRVEEAINSVDRDMGTLLSVSISSRNKDIVKRTVKLIKVNLSTKPGDVWELLRGREGGINNLAFAASMPEFPAEQGGKGIAMFRVVYDALKEGAKEAFPTAYIDVLRGLFIPETKLDDKTMQTPLTRAMLSRNPDLFDAVYASYNDIEGPGGSSWTRQQVLEQIPVRSEIGPEGTNKLFLAAFGGAVLDNRISPTMFFALTKAIQNAAPAANEAHRRAEDRLASQRLQSLIQAAAELGSFDLFRCSPFYHETIPCLLKAIGDYEDNVIEAVMLAIMSASNPFVTCAVASRYIDKAARDLPMHRNGLRLLQRKMDALSMEVLNELPNTVRGVGRAFGAHNSVLLQLKNDPETQKKYGRLCAKIGFVVMRWILEPRIVQETASQDLRSEGERMGGDGASRPAWMPPSDMRGAECIDPLQRALDRGSQALDFINAPLVLDYMLLKFSATIPPWTASNPFTYNMGEKFYTHTLRDSTDPNRVHKEKKVDELKPADLLMRFLQGWNTGEKIGSGRLRVFRVPHETLLPGLQFTLAGIIGAPATFYGVPAIRYSYELLSYIAMVGLFCSCVRIEDHRVVPYNEICFYIFVLGLLWRELLEFREVLPTHRVLISDLDPAFSNRAPPRRLSTIVGSYLFQDAWNILDSLTLLCVAGAFMFRMIALHEDGEADQSDNISIGDKAMETAPVANQSPVLWARVLLAVSAIPLFARILSLSQIDGTLGPMTQIIWTMLSHLGKFSVFLAVLMASFALTFHVLFYECAEENSALYQSFNTFGDSYLTMFKAMLGDFDFDSFKYADKCYRPGLAEEVGVTLLVLYLAIMAILLLNLLIAVLSTAHADVHKNAEKEFHLARSKLIQQSWRATLKGRQPPPMNLLMPLMGLAADFIGELWAVGRSMHQRFRNTPRSETTRRGKTKAFSETYLWDAWLGSVHRTVFAITVGWMAVAVCSILWLLSIPWLAWCIYQWWLQSLQDRSHGSWSSGYGRPSVALLLNGVGWAVAMALATVLSIACSLGSVVLWVFGLWGIGQWWVNENASRRKGRRPRQRDWVFAENAVSARSGGNLRHDERQFRVDLLLKETTGLDVEDISLRIKRRDRAALARADVDEDVFHEDLGQSLSRYPLEYNATSSFPSSLSVSAAGSSSNKATSGIGDESSGIQGV